jgi:ankyrin repeat protein
VPAVNKVLEKAVEENGGPLFLERRNGKSFYDKLAALDPAGALEELNAAVDASRFVGDAAARATPLLWACERATGDKVHEWTKLAMALVARPGVDVHARNALGESALALVAARGNSYSIVELVPALFAKGVRDAAALGRAFKISWVDSGWAEWASSPAPALLQLAQDDSILTLNENERSILLANALKNGFDAIAIALFEKNFRIADASSMLLLAAAGGCTSIIKLLCTGPIPIVPVGKIFANLQTALHVACMHGRGKAALALLECGAVPSGSDIFYMSPIM